MDKLSLHDLKHHFNLVDELSMIKDEANLRKSNGPSQIGTPKIRAWRKKHLERHLNDFYSPLVNDFLDLGYDKMH